MFENFNPMDRSTAYLEIGIIILITFILGYLVARIPLGGEVNEKLKKIAKPKKEEEEEEEVDPRDIITEPTEIRAVLTRDRKGKAINSPDDANKIKE